MNGRVSNIKISDGNVIVKGTSLENAGVSFNGKKILICGKGGSGKSWFTDMILN